MTFKLWNKRGYLPDSGPANTNDEPSSQHGKRWIPFALFIVIPSIFVTSYLWLLATDRYVTEFRLTVRQQMPLRGEGPISSPLSGGNPLMALIVDSEVVVQYLKSRQIIDDVSTKINLSQMYGNGTWDPLYRLQPEAAIEDRLRHWKRIVDPYFDLTNGIITVKVQAFSPDDALLLATTVLELSERLINDLSKRAAQDSLVYAERSVQDAANRLASVQRRMSDFRNANAILFPQIQAGTFSGVEGRLRDALAEARSAFNSLKAEGVSPSAPQMKSLEARIAATETELRDVQSKQATSILVNGNANLATALAGYSALEAEERLVLGLYEKALTNLEAARATALQQLVYLNAFVRPAKPEKSTEPARWLILIEVLIGGALAWILGSLLVRGVRDKLG